jgi:hypothetical protein
LIVSQGEALGMLITPSADQNDAIDAESLNNSQVSPRQVTSPMISIARAWELEVASKSTACMHV